MNDLFLGVHEIRLFCPNRVCVGYFDDWDAAVRAVEAEPSTYKAAYFTLNPVKLPPGVRFSPTGLTASSRATGDAEIERRTWLLIDVDPPRPAKTNASESEKQAAREQAERIREWLRSHGWPDPVLADSGNGWHLLYRISLANDEPSKALIESFLVRLKQLFPMVDSGNFNASRLCKLYGSWARKGEHTEERPHRRSSIVEEGSGVVVTEQQIQALVPAPSSAITARLEADNVKLSSLLGFLNYYGVALRSDPREVSGGWQVEIECPWSSEHSGENPRDSVVSFIAGLGNGFKCFHSHCAHRHWRELRRELERRNPGLAPYYGKLPSITHSDIARSFIETHDDFVRVYDLKNETGVWIPGTRWELGDAGDVLLRRAIRRYLDVLHDRYGPPEPEQRRDSRRALKQAAFVSGVLAEVKPWLPPKASRDFDTNPALLPLPNGKVADLKLGIVREMCREDCQTKRIATTPADSPTPRWDRFLREITCGDPDLAAFIVRVCALAITGVSLHVLIFFEGTGRNGKGCLCRLIEHLIGRDLYSAVVKPSEIEFQHGASERDKRLYGRLRGMRFCYTGETVGSNLDWTLLKTLSGGDSLSGAKLYANETGFKPSHTLVLLTNDRPKLPPTAAFKGRLVYVPFRADFSSKPDLALENDLKLEAPGILWQLIKAAPTIFERGIEPPACVLEASEDVLDENDAARPFIEERLIEDREAVTTIRELETAVKKWIGGTVLGRNGQFDRIMQGVRSRWSTGRKRVGGEQIRGLLGVRLRPSS